MLGIESGPMKAKPKQLFIIALLVLILIGWGLSLFVALPEHVDPLLLFAIFLPVIPTGVLLWILSRSIPNSILKNIHQISLRVERDLEKERMAIDTNNIPAEIVPLVTSINRLLSYHHDRHEQERDFAAHASHELRTPLAGIRLQTEIAMATSDLQVRENALKNVIKSVDRGTRLVEQLLAISRLTSEKVDLAKEHVDLVSLIEKVTRDNLASAQQKHIELSCSCPEKSLFIEASEQSIQILADNLIRNAITYTPRQGKVSIHLERDTERNFATFVVEDTGPGIPANLRQRVMRRFEKAEKGSKSGTGLGLAIAQRIVDLHAGRISLEDSHSGKGLRIVVSLPKKTTRSLS